MGVVLAGFGFIFEVIFEGFGDDFCLIWKDFGKQNGANKIKIKMTFSDYGRISESRTKQTKLRIIADATPP